MNVQGKERLGLYGGTFDPPHLGHIGAARAFLDAADLDRLLIVPDYLPPHKVYASSTTAEDRLAMCRLAFGDLPHTEISDIEIRRGGKSYTYVTLEEIQAPDRELFLLVGTDMFLTLDAWRSPERIFAAATIAYVRRENDLAAESAISEKAEFYRSKYAAKLLAVPLAVREISSSDLRADLAANGVSRGGLAPAVADYIRSKGIYRDIHRY